MSGVLTDKELVEKVKNREEKSFEELISRYSEKAFGLARRLTGNMEDAEEVLQDVFVSVYRKIDSFEGKSSFSSWLYRITVNSAYMKLRKKRQDRSVYMEDVQPQIKERMLRATSVVDEADYATLRKQVGAALEEAINKLPDDYRPVFVLRDVNGLTSQEVGKILDLSIPAVKSRLHRSRLMLRRKLVTFYKEFTSIRELPRDLLTN